MGSILGLPRFDTVEFEARFPFAKVSLTDKDIPVKVTILGWSPFIPGDPDNSSLPVGGLEYSLENTSKEVQETIFSYHARNFLSWGRIGCYKNDASWVYPFTVRYRNGASFAG